MVKKSMVKVYTDGGVRPTNPGPGGWAYVATLDGLEIARRSHYDILTTNNQMELTAAINALQDHLDYKQGVEIISDSAYVVSGANEWIDKWVERGWRTAAFKSIHNKDLWRAIWSLKHEYTERGIPLVFTHVRGHQGERWNELADGLATERALFAGRK